MMIYDNSNLKFTYSDYKKFINYAKEIAPICSFANWNHSVAIILRHDVDIDLRSAYKLAMIEKKIGIKSSFFIMTTNYYYNILNPTNSNLLKLMSEDGFEIGLHFDPSIYGNKTLKELEEKMKFECNILENIIDSSIKSISLHNPSLNNQYPIFDGYNNAYSKEIFSDDKYLSDSCMDFRGKNPYSFVKKAKDVTLQIVIHPEHWSENGQNYIGFFIKFLDDFIDYIDDNFRDNRTYKKIIDSTRLKNIIYGAEHDGKKNKDQ